VFADLDQLGEILEPGEAARVREEIAELGNLPDTAGVYQTLRRLYDNQEISLTSFCKVFNYLADDELPVLTYRGETLKEITRQPARTDVAEPVATEAPKSVGDHLKPLGKLGEGGSGEVLIARDTHLERRVALKRLKQYEMVPEHIKERFLNEAQVTAQLDHPNIIPIYGLHAVTGQSLGYAMKLVRGRDLASLIDEVRRRLERNVPLGEGHDLNSRLDIFLKICDAIDFAHSKGVLHRDLKPSNIMIGRFGEVYVMDWGIAQIKIGGKDRDTETVQPVLSGVDPTDRTQTGGLVGTPLYMSPEQAEGRDLDERSDQYTLGLILYELVCLQRAKPGKTSFEVISNTVRGKHKPIRHVLPRRKVPRELTAIIAKAVRHEPVERYASVHELAADLRRYLRGDAVIARPDTWNEKLIRKIGRHRQLALIAFLLAIFLAAGSLIMGELQVMRTRNEGLVRAADQAAKVSRLVSMTADRAHAIDTFFRTHEIALRNLAFEVTLLLERESLGEGDLYNHLDFAGGRVPDLIDSSAYGMRVSTVWPVCFTAGSDTAEARARARRLAPIRHHFRRMMVPAGASVEESRLDQMIAEKQGTVVWVYLCFTDGSIILYPGIDRFPAGYDPRDRPWYELGSGREEVVWHGIYRTVTGDEPELPCSIVLRDADDAPIGVALLNIAFDRISDELLPLAADGVVNTFLLDDQGRVMVSSSDKEIAFGEGVDLLTKPFPFADVLDRLEEDGHVDYRAGDAHWWLTSRRLETKGWRYVVQVDPDHLAR